MAIRFVHSAAWQLGLGSAVLPAAGPRLREARFAAAKRVIDAASESRADFILLAGDTFAHPLVGSATLERALALFAAASCPVYVLPGDCDAPLAGSVWEQDDAWRDAANVHLLGVDASEAVAADPATGAQLWAFPSPAWHGRSAATAQPQQRGEQVRIGVATALAHVPPEQVAALDYLALSVNGEAASHDEPLPPPHGIAEVVVAPSPEPRDFEAQSEDGSALLVELDGSTTPRVEKLPTGVLRWRTFTAEVHSRGELDAARQELGTWLDDGHDHDEVLRLRLSGQLPLADAAALDALLGWLEPRCVAVVLDAHELKWVPPEGHAAAQQLPPGPVRDAWTQLATQATHDATAREALRELLRRVDADDNGQP